MTVEIADLVIVGSGPTGMAAACEARSLGLSVLMLDEQAAVGGQIYRGIEVASLPRTNILGDDYAAGRELAANFRVSGATHLGGAVVWNLSSDGTVDYVINGKSRKVTGRFVLIATGAMERPFPIDGWTLPGVMGAGAAQILLKSAGAIPTGSVVLAGCGPLLYLLAWQYFRAGIEIRAFVDTTSPSAYLRATRHIGGALRGWRDLVKGLKLRTALRQSGAAWYTGCSNFSVQGNGRAEGLAFSHRGCAVRIPASLVLLHQGVVPNTQLSWSIGAAHRWSPEQLCWEPVTDAWGRIGEAVIYVAGDSRAIVGARASAIQGRLTALEIGKQLGVASDIERRLAVLQRELRQHLHIRSFLDVLYRPLDEFRIPGRDDVIVCRCEEVTAGQIREYVELGCLGPNQTKAFGRCGMGLCQGRFCGLTVTEIISSARGVGPADIGYYRVRPPIKPVLLSELME